MSWDVILLSRYPVGAGAERPPPLGEADEVRRKISRSVAGVDWSDPAWGIFDGDGWSIEFNHQSEGLSDSVMLHVRGHGDPVTTISKLCSDTGWVAFDTTEGEVIAPGAQTALGWEKFKA